MASISRRVCALATVGVVLLSACGEGPEGEGGGEAERSPGASATNADSASFLADRLLEWQGGADAWERTRFLRFRWIVERSGDVLADRSHAWDRHEGRYRLSYLQNDSTRFYALFDVESMKSDSVAPEGDVWVGGDRLEGAARDSALQRSYAIFINDSYWLTMPLKWRDPGVHLGFDGWRELPDGQRHPTVHLTFEEGLGVTNDQYWAFLDPESGRIVAWQYHLEGREEKGSLIWWRDWRTFGPQSLKLAMDRRWETGDTRIRFEDVAVDTVAPDSVFRPPSR